MKKERWKQRMWGWLDSKEKNVCIEFPEVLVAQSCLTLCDSMDRSPPGFSVRGIFQARILRLSRLCKMRLDSRALCPEQLRFPNQTRKEPRIAWLNSRESPTKLSQDAKNTDVTPGMQNCSVYPISIWDEANFPCIGSITTPRSTSYRTSGLTPFRNL